MANFKKSAVALGHGKSVFIRVYAYTIRDAREEHVHLHGILLQHNSIKQKGSSCCGRENKP